MTPMGDAHVLEFGMTYDMVAARTACGQLLTLTSHGSGVETPPHRHVNNYLSIVLTGGFAEQEGRRWHERLSGGFFIHHPDETHHDRFGRNGAVCVNLHFPIGQPAAGVEGKCTLSMRIAAEKLAFELTAGSREELAMACLAAEIMGELKPCDGYSKDAGRWIHRLIEAFSDRPERRWTLHELALIADRHPVHVARAFRAQTGISVGEFQRLRRLTSIGLALRTKSTRLAALALDYGYCDQSHLTSEFRAAFGTSPGRYRREFH